MVRIGVDTGGTFTDVVLYDDETGEIHVTKTPSTPPKFDEGVLGGIDKILDQTGTAPSAVEFLSHGTTVGTNAVLEGEIADIGLLTNEGLRDVLEIGDQTRPELYNLQTEKPPELVPRRRRLGVPGRIDSNGEVVDPLDEDAARGAIAELVDRDVESIVVSTLFSYKNPRHERRLGDLIEEAAPETSYALSSEIHPEIREYDRTITTVINEAVKLTVEDYFERLDEGVRERGIDATVNVMHSGGGIFTSRQATRRAVRTVLSGPAAGAVAARDVSEDESFPDAVGLDVGGTSADVSVIRDGAIERTTEGEIADLPINVPMIDINTVGAGGGSIVWLDEGGAIRVGPESSGADPGPICYGRGGERPTVTDANLMLGRLNAEYFLDGEMDLAVERTREAFERELADPLGLSVEEAALAAIQVTNAKMGREIKRVTVERGHDPASFALVGFGGAGPLQAPDIARNMDMNAAIIPRNPGVLSARGLLVADVRVDESHSYRSDAVDAGSLRRQFVALEETLRERLAEQGLEEDEMTIRREVDIRYQGQSYELTVPLTGTGAAVDGADAAMDEETIEEVLERFHDHHERRYGHAMRDEPVEFVTLRANGLAATPEVADQVTVTDRDHHQGVRSVYFEGGFRDAAVYHRPAMDTGAVIEGPAILEEPVSTAIVPPDATAELSERGNVIVRL